ncbi:hypothetical protein D6817_02400 [Candidatus Pacearchaeota archaeon]|nr:MAG: hypothetical protein D6817_02400 [Candidatus Pacearchaeota archaeon]
MEKQGKSVGVVAVKGGVGKTTVGINLASALAREFGKQVVLVDANFTTPHVALSLGLVEPQLSLHDVLEGNYSVFQALHYHKDGRFYILPGKLNARTDKHHKLKREVDKLRKHFDFIVIDSSPSANDEMLSAISASDELVVVTTPDYPTFSSTLQAVKLAQEKKVPIAGIVLNSVLGKRFEISPREIEQALGVCVLGEVPRDNKVIEAVYHGLPVIVHSPRRKVSRQYKKLGAKLLGQENYDAGFLDRLNKFIARLRNVR